MTIFGIRAAAPHRLCSRAIKTWLMISIQAAILKTSSPKPLKIPLFPLASGRHDVDERLGISVDQLTEPVPFRPIPHRHDFYHLFWVESGSGIFVSDGRSYPVTRGSLIFVPPSQV